MFGLLNVDKPPGMTSRDVVNRVQRLVRPVRCGHAGTLDPLATGVLILGLGPATRLVPFIQRQPKSYLATFLLGRRSESADIDSNVEILEDAPVATREQLEDVLPQFRGTILQRPPVYSAVKVGGRRAYSLARSGVKVEMPERTVVIHALSVLRFEYPEFELAIRCSSGTYVRSLGRDLAEKLGTAAVMSALVRTAIGPFLLSESVNLDQLTTESFPDCLQPAGLAVESLPQLVVSAAEQRRLSRGQDIARSSPAGCEEIAAVNRQGRLVAIITPRHPGVLRPLKNFPVSE